MPLPAHKVNTCCWRRKRLINSTSSGLFTSLSGVKTAFSVHEIFFYYLI
ncbi:hypothetical protein YPPY58_4003 [Yersinia pestis PY-58]|nr:hypothetical protein YPPY58_4003 [Yersinia pestis PY-58]